MACVRSYADDCTDFPATAPMDFHEAERSPQFIRFFEYESEE